MEKEETVDESAGNSGRWALKVTCEVNRRSGRCRNRAANFWVRLGIVRTVQGPLLAWYRPGNLVM